MTCWSEFNFWWSPVGTALGYIRSMQEWSIDFFCHCRPFLAKITVSLTPARVSCSIWHSLSWSRQSAWIWSSALSSTLSRSCEIRRWAQKKAFVCILQAHFDCCSPWRMNCVYAAEWGAVSMQLHISSTRIHFRADTNCASSLSISFSTSKSLYWHVMEFLHRCVLHLIPVKSA